MTGIDESMKRRLGSFTRWWRTKCYQLGDLLGDVSVEPGPARISTFHSARAPKSGDESIYIRADVPVDMSDVADAKEMHAAWARGEAHVSVKSGKGRIPTAEERLAHLRDPNVIPGPPSAEDIGTMVQTLPQHYRNFAPPGTFVDDKPAVNRGYTYDPKTDTIEKKS